MAQVTVLVNGKPITINETTPGLMGQLGYTYVSGGTNTPSSQTSQPSPTPAPSVNNEWRLSNWSSTGNGTWSSQPVLTIDGKNYQYATPQEYINQLQNLQAHGASGNLSQMISELQGALPEFNKISTTAPKATTNTSTNTNSPATTTPNPVNQRYLSAIIEGGNLQPGNEGSAVRDLQSYLVSQGYMTQAQMNTGTGIYGPATTAAVLAMQKDLGIDYSSGPGYFGPKTISALSTFLSTPATGTTPTNTQTTPQTSNNTSNTTTSQTNNSTVTPTGITKQLDLGMTDPEVTALQKFLNANGYPVASTGPGSPGNETSYFGPSTQAALEKYQSAQGIVTSGTPESTGYGRVGPLTLSSIQNYTSPTTNGTTGTTASPTGSNITQYAGIKYDLNDPAQATAYNKASGSNVPIPTTTGAAALTTTGNPQLDALQKQLTDLQTSISEGFKIDPNLDPSQHPEIIKQFLDWAHQVVDPQTQQTINNHITNINSDLANQAKNYGYSQANIIQTFGTDLANEQETAGGAGTAFSGQRGINEGNLVRSTNRNLASLTSNAQYNIGNALRTGAADVGSANTNQFNLPTIAGGNVSTEGGQRGSFTSGMNMANGDFGYDPNAYKVSNIGNTAAQNVNTQQADYLRQYSTLATNNANAGRSVSDLFGLISGRPA